MLVGGRSYDHTFEPIAISTVQIEERFKRLFHMSVWPIPSQPVLFPSRQVYRKQQTDRNLPTKSWLSQHPIGKDAMCSESFIMASSCVKMNSYTYLRYTHPLRFRGWLLDAKSIWDIILLFYFQSWGLQYLNYISPFTLGQDLHSSLSRWNWPELETGLVLGSLTRVISLNLFSREKE